MDVLGLGFPVGVRVPTKVSACGDGVHTAVARMGETADCACDRFTIDLTDYDRWPGLYRVVVADAAMDGAPVRSVRRLDVVLVRS